MQLDQAMLEAVQQAFWLLYLPSLAAAGISAMLTRRWCIARAFFALAGASLAQTLLESWMAAPLGWPQHLAIDFAVFVLITLPPRHYWQSTLGALVLVQLILHSCLAVEGIDPRLHWLGVTLVGIAKAVVLLAWSGGARVEIVLGRAARLPARLVPAALAGKLARR